MATYDYLFPPVASQARCKGMKGLFALVWLLVDKVPLVSCFSRPIFSFACKAISSKIYHSRRYFCEYYDALYGKDAYSIGLSSCP